MPHEQSRQDLADIIELLETDGLDGWADFFREAFSILEAGSVAECGSHILSGSGGMGSLNDLVLGQAVDATGKVIWKPGYKELNERFLELLGRLYSFSHHARKST